MRIFAVSVILESVCVCAELSLCVCSPLCDHYCVQHAHNTCVYTIVYTSCPLSIPHLTDTSGVALTGHLGFVLNYEYHY